MVEKFKNISRIYLAFNRNDRIAVLILMALILILIAAGALVNGVEYVPANDPNGLREFILAMDSCRQQERSAPLYFYFNPNDISSNKLDSFSLPAQVRRNILSYRNAGGKFREPTDLRKIYGMNDSLFKVVEPWLVLPAAEPRQVIVAQHGNRIEVKGSFDPNTADPDTLLRFGFSQKQISTLVNYRNSGAVFIVPHDLLRVYGIDSAFFAQIEENIQIKKRADVHFPAQAPPVVNSVELNRVDSAGLVALRGIGPVFASRILRYRNLLGGYCNPIQLLEVYGFPEETYRDLSKSLTADTLCIEKLRLNFTEYHELIRHPYLKKENVTAILEYREKYGAFTNNSQLLNFGLVDTITFIKVEPYVTCR